MDMTTLLHCDLRNWSSQTSKRPVALLPSSPALFLASDYRRFPSTAAPLEGLQGPDLETSSAAPTVVSTPIFTYKGQEPTELLVVDT